MDGPDVSKVIFDDNHGKISNLSIYNVYCNTEYVKSNHYLPLINLGLLL